MRPTFNVQSERSVGCDEFLDEGVAEVDYYLVFITTFPFLKR